MVLHAAETTSWSSPTVVLPLVAAIVSLLGVLWVSYYSGKRMLHLEERRQVATASQERMSTLRAERRALYKRLVKWQHETSQRVVRFFPLDGELHDSWLSRVLPWIHHEMIGDDILRPMVYEAEITGSPHPIWSSAVEFAEIATAIHNEVTYAVDNPSSGYETYLPNLWLEGARLQEVTLMHLLDDLGVATGSLGTMEQVELLRVESTLKVLRWRLVKKLRFKWGALVLRVKTRLSPQP
ncbi:hypothetical protein [Oerskovia paurometabola]|uniref:hypothetical protein n=1 Tax=Oerskovia paurometabola TaxID=162170 RepID=UPI00343C88DE